MKAKALETIRQYRMLERGDRVVVGVSGGADSVALLSLLCALREEYALHLTVCHINHNLRGAESLRDEQFVRALCTRLGVECRVCSEDVAALAQRQGLSVEEAARGLRYRFFAETAGEGAKIATAHTAGDNAETMLLNLTRGSGLRGLCGIPPVRDNIIRPLIACTRAETEGWCRQNGLDWMEDSTNAADDYTRNRLRHHVVPVLRQQNPRLDEALAETAARLRRDADLLDALAAQAAQQLSAPDGSLDRAGFLARPRPLQDRILLGLMSGHAQPNARLAGLCLALARRGGGSQQLAEGVFFRADQSRLWVERKVPPAPTGEALVLPPMKVGESRTLCLGGRRVCLSLQTQQASSQNVYNFPLKNCLCYDKIQNTLVLRTRRTGDRITLARRGVSKTLKKLFCEEKVPQQEREHRLVLADQSGRVFWAEGIGCAAQTLPGPQSRLLLQLTIIDGEHPGEDKQL